jgi:feruloyl-CoA synthase
VVDAVVAGSGRADVAVLVFARPDGAAPPDYYATLLTRVNAGAHGSAARVARLLVLAEAPDGARGELTDKGSVNGAAVLANRADLVDALYAGHAPGMLQNLG